MKLHHSSTKSF